MIALGQHISVSLELHVVLVVVVIATSVWMLMFAQQDVLMLLSNSSNQLPEMNYAVYC